MNVILIQDVKNLGPLGTEIEVKDGYARNYLIPQKLAMEATPAALLVLEKKKRASWEPAHPLLELLRLKIGEKNIIYYQHILELHFQFLLNKQEL